MRMRSGRFFHESLLGPCADTVEADSLLRALGSPDQLRARRSIATSSGDVRREIEEIDPARGHSDPSPHLERLARRDS